MGRAKKVVISGKDGAQEAWRQALIEIPVPSTLTINTPLKRELWEAFVAVRAPADWRMSDLLIVAELVEVSQEYQTECKLLEVEGSILRTDRGTPVTNPRHNVRDGLSRRRLSLMKALSLNALPGAGEASGSIADRGKAVSIAKKTITDGDYKEVELLAQPSK